MISIENDKSQAFWADFICQDKVVAHPENLVWVFRRYHCENDPINKRDPSGKADIVSDLLFLGFAAGAAWVASPQGQADISSAENSVGDLFNEQFLLEKTLLFGSLGTSLLFAQSLTGSSSSGNSSSDMGGDTSSGGLEPEESGGRSEARLKMKARDLIKGRLKNSESYHSELADKTYEEILNDNSQAAKQMKKLIEQSKRLMDKNY